MDNTVVEGLSNLCLTKEEEEEISIKSRCKSDLLEECSLSLFGHLLADRNQNSRALKNTLRMAWKMGSDLQIVDVGSGIMQWQRGLFATNISFTHSPFWVQIWGLPFELRSDEVGRELGNNIGRFVEVDRRARHSVQAKFMRIRMDLQLDKPLRRGEKLLAWKISSTSVSDNGNGPLGSMEDRRISSSKNFEQPNGFSEGDGAQRAARAQSNRKEQATIGESGACDGNNSSFSKLPCKALDNESMRGTMGNLGNVTARDLSERPLTDLQGGIMEFVGSEDAFSLAGQQVHSEKQDMEVNSPIKPIADQRKKKETALETTGQGLDGKIKATGQWKRLAREKGKNKSPGKEIHLMNIGSKRGGKLIFEEEKLVAP
nr:hypothetical protein CFP56_40514 [Quercus suber]